MKGINELSIYSFSNFILVANVLVNQIESRKSIKLDLSKSSRPALSLGINYRNGYSMARRFDQKYSRIRIHVENLRVFEILQLFEILQHGEKSWT